MAEDENDEVSGDEDFENEEELNIAIILLSGKFARGSSDPSMDTVLTSAAIRTPLPFFAKNDEQLVVLNWLKPNHEFLSPTTTAPSFSRKGPCTS